MKSIAKHRGTITLAHLMALVAVAAVLISLAILALGVAANLLDDTYYPATRTFTRTWGVGPLPSISVDLFEGYITVLPSADGKVTATITPFAVTKESQAAADAALDDILIAAKREGDVIRIKTTRAPAISSPKILLSQLKANIELRVPPDASVELLTGHGYIYVGKDGGGPTATISPVALRSLKARDMGESYIGIEAEIASRPSLPATVLDLESLHGTIQIRGDNVLIRAKTVGGGIDYAGRPAPGSHSFVTRQYVPHPDENWRLSKGVRLVLPADSAFQVDAESNGGVSSDFPAEQEDPNVLKGGVGVDPRAKLEIRSGDGPIQIRTLPSG